MSPSGRFHRTGTAVLSLAMLLIGLMLAVQALAGGGGGVVRLLLGLLFAGAGAGRLYLLSRRTSS